MDFDEFKHQLPDIDPNETAEWLASFDQLVEQEGESRARFLVYKLLKRARQGGWTWPDRFDVHNSIVHNVPMNTIYDLSATSNHGDQIDFSGFRGRPMLIVNTASKCGFTPQYDGLQALHERYGPEGLVVIGFPCNQFAHQEPLDDAGVEEFCRINFGVTFPLTTKVEVNGKGTHPVFAFLKERTGGRLGTAVKWNFTKFLVAPDGTSVKRYAPNTEPAKLAGDIGLLLSDAAA